MGREGMRWELLLLGTGMGKIFLLLEPLFYLSLGSMLSLTATALAAGLKGGGLLCSLKPLCWLLLSRHILPFINATEFGFGSNGSRKVQ
jgi:hypothetical protein